MEPKVEENAHTHTQVFPKTKTLGSTSCLGSGTFSSLSPLPSPPSAYITAGTSTEKRSREIDAIITYDAPSRAKGICVLLNSR